MMTSARANPSAGARERRSRFRDRHPLLNPFPVIVATLAGFLVTFAFLTAQLSNGRDPAVGQLAARVSSASGAPAMRTRASGGAGAAGQSSAAPGQPGQAALVSRASGVLIGEDDG